LQNFIELIDNKIHPDRMRKVKFYFRKVIIAFSLILFSIAFGVVGYVVIEGYSLLDAFYMTIITISTVGYGEVEPLTEAGKLFSALLIITNIGIFTFALTSLSSFIIDGHFRRIFHDLNIGRKIDRMKDHVIICGYGRYGKSVAAHLLKQGINCVVIEASREMVEQIREDSLLIALDGDATDEDVLGEAGIDHARALMTTLPDDANNVYVTLTARQLNPNLKIVSRANIASSEAKLIRAGADHVLVPENIGGFYMSALVTKPDIIEVFTDLAGLKDRQFRMAEIVLDKIPEHLTNKQIKDMAIPESSGVQIIGLKQSDGTFVVNPSGETNLMEGCALLVLGNEDQISKFHDHTKEFKFIE